MSCVVYLTNKKTGYMYAYESVSYRDPVSKKPKSKRTFIGRVDPISKQLLDPDKAQRLKEKRKSKTSQLSGNDDIKLNTETDPAMSNEIIIEELRQIKELLLQDHDELRRVQDAQERSRESVLAAVNLLQQSFRS